MRSSGDACLLPHGARSVLSDLRVGCYQSGLEVGRRVP